MIFEQAHRLVADELPYQGPRMFQQEQHFAFAPVDAAAGSPRLTLHMAAFDGRARLGRVRSTGHQIRLSEPGHTSFLVPRRGALKVTTGRDTYVGRPGDALIFPPNVRSTVVVPDGAGLYVCDCLLVPTAAVAGEAPLDDRLPAHRVEQAMSGDGDQRPDAALRRYIDLVFEEGLQPQSSLGHARVRGAAGALLQELLGELVGKLAPAATTEPLASPDAARLVRSAEELMLAQLDQPLTVAELARRLGVSVRSLQYAFQRVRNATPRAVLGQLRLEWARRRLAEPGGERSVTEVALDCGIAHFGRFAAAYARRYGERPSETLRRAQRR